MFSRLPRTVLLIALGLLLSAVSGGCDAGEDRADSAADALSEAAIPHARAHFGHRLEPAGNAVLIGAGQTDVASFLDFAQSVAPTRPTVFMTYVDLRDDLPAWFARLQQDLGTPALRTVSPQIGLSLNRGEAHTHYEAETARGDDDQAISELCKGFAALDRPVFLRPGYEFNGPWNGYLPTSYVAAFRRIASRIHSCAPQAALVWDWSADAEMDVENGGSTAPASSRWQPYYPGDDAVDWWALNLFSTPGIRSAATAEFLHAAGGSHHPVMIAESAPKGYDLANPSSARAAWRQWFVPYFALIHHYPGIRAFCYIHWNWAIYPQWSDWGNSRTLQAPEDVQQDLRNELAKPLYNHGTQ